MTNLNNDEALERLYRDVKAMKKDHGLLFKPDMIRAFLEKRKSQTRRVLTRMNVNVNGSGRCSKEYWEGYDFNDAFVDPGPSPAGNPGPYLKVFNKIADARDRLYPIYMVGDRMWCKETFVDFPTTKVIYKADCNETEAKWFRWVSPIFMPKKHARIWRKITEVRIQRVQEISNDDIVAEGIPIWELYPTLTMSQELDNHLGKMESLCREYGLKIDSNKIIEAGLPSAMECVILDYHKKKFADLWESINANRGYPWENNDWVIALTLE